VLGVVILAAVVIAPVAVISVILGASWWLALLIYAIGGTGLVGCAACLFALRRGNDPQTVRDAHARDPVRQSVGQAARHRTG